MSIHVQTGDLRINRDQDVQAGPEGRGFESQTSDARAGELRQIGVRLWDRWTDMWNGELSLGEQIISPDFGVRFGSGPDGIRGPRELVEFIGAFRATYQRLRYSTGVGPIVDLEIVGGVLTGHVACRWTADVVEGDGTARPSAGHDILRIEDGLIAYAWSISEPPDAPSAG